MRKPLTILLLSAGRRVALMEAFRSDAKLLGIDLRVLAVDLKPELSAACAFADQAFAAPRCTSPEYRSFLLNLCKQADVRLVIPTIDTELLGLSELSDDLARQGTKAAISSSTLIGLARDKLSTARAMQEFGVSAPRTVTLEDFDSNDESWKWPLFVKPRSGSSSVGIQKIERQDIDGLPKSSDLIVQECLRGSEYTVNMYFGADGELKAVVPHLRIETRGGEVSKAETVRNEAVETIGWNLGRRLKGAYGPICFQVMNRSDGAPALFEINARFGGGYPIAHHAGATFTKWLLEEAAGMPSSANNEWRSGVRMLRYDQAVFR